MHVNACVTRSFVLGTTRSRRVEYSDHLANEWTKTAASHRQEMPRGALIKNEYPNGRIILDTFTKN
jgi:hypothetical protein